jgi:hypothetical protein
VLIGRGVPEGTVRRRAGAGLPSYVRRVRPVSYDFPPPLILHQFTGALDEVYATLVVNHDQSKAFARDGLRHDEADFTTPASRRIALRLTRHPGPVGAITVRLDSALLTGQTSWTMRGCAFWVCSRSIRTRCRQRGSGSN